ncbi:hypothetical protein EEB14_17045 [Rhodococcus sp. WS4]|nr:hypothetical protein EEB14_17045 [Rhodococcus sp. WS4]
MATDRTPYGTDHVVNGVQLTVAVDLSTPDAPVGSTIVVRRPDDPDTVRITAPNLREAQKKRAYIRAAGDTSGGRVDVLLDVVVHIAPDARTARSEVGTAQRRSSATGMTEGDTVVYVGTPSGLASLILDIRAADIADGVTVVPAVMERNSRDACVQLLLDEVLPILEARGPVQESAVRQHAH